MVINFPQYITLLKANSGTDANVGATNVDTYAIPSGLLTAKDSLLVLATIGSTTQQTAAPIIYNNTDGVAIITDTTPVAAGTVQLYHVMIRQRQTSALAILAQGALDNGGVGGAAHTSTKTAVSAFVTAWTAAWTIALRHGGVIAGGTCDWSWSLYRVSGQ